MKLVWGWLLLVALRVGQATAQTRVSTTAELQAAADAGVEVIILTDHIFLGCSDDSLDCEYADLSESTVAVVVRNLTAEYLQPLVTAGRALTAKGSNDQRRTRTSELTIDSDC